MLNKIIPINTADQINFIEHHIKIDSHTNIILGTHPATEFQENNLMAAQLTVFILKEDPQKTILFRKKPGTTLAGQLSFQSGKINNFDLVKQEVGQPLSRESINCGVIREIKEELGFTVEPAQIRPFCHIDMQPIGKKFSYRLFINLIEISEEDIKKFVYDDDLEESVIVDIDCDPYQLEPRAENGFYQLFEKLKNSSPINSPEINISLTLKNQNITSFNYTPNTYIPIKGLLPKYDYGNINFGEIFSISKSLTPLQFYKKYIENDFSFLKKNKHTTPVINQQLAYNEITNIFMLPKKNIKNILKTEIPYTLWTTIIGNADAFVWQDSFFKVDVEKAVDSGLIKKNDLLDKVYQTIQLYVDLLKMTGPQGELELFLRNMDIQIANLLQRLCVNFIVGKGLELSSESIGEGTTRNSAIINFIENAGFSLSGSTDSLLESLIKLSIFCGIYWPPTETLKSGSGSFAAQIIGDKIFKAQANILKINHIDKFIKKLDTSNSLTMILDDNGESVFDLFLAQTILQKYPNIKINFLINKFPVSINISEDTFETVLKAPLFKSLKELRQNGRARVLFQNCPFNSFQTTHLTPETVATIKQSDFIYVKGQNFFESFETSLGDTFYAFVSSSDMNIKLTGFDRRAGLFVYLEQHQKRFLVKNNLITSLKELIGLEN
jgi:8-oxo-dGTP pyrophosphatase MutT (NUDIX family)